MDNYSIDIRDGVEYIVDHVNKFVLKAIPDDEMSERGYPLGTPVVEARYYDREPDGSWNVFSDYQCLDFYGMDIDYHGRDSRDSNWRLWDKAIQYYSTAVLGYPADEIQPFNPEADIIPQEHMAEHNEWLALGETSSRSDEFFNAFTGNSSNVKVLLRRALG